MSVIDSAVNWAIAIANDDSHGYSQDANIRYGNPDYDCSSLVISAFKQAGVPLESTFTGNMYRDFLRHGFKDVTASVNLANGAGLRRGDVLLNVNRHTAISLGNGTLVHAASSENGGKYGTPGDQTGKEICVRSYYNRPWDCVLRFVEEATPEPTPTPSKEIKVMVEIRQIQYGSKGADVKALQSILNAKANARLACDGDFGKLTKNAVTEFQRSRGLQADSIVGKNTWSALINS